MALMVSVSGIRGVVGKDLTPRAIVNFIQAFIRALGREHGVILIGRDTRASGLFIEKIVEGTILACGLDVINTGIATTPTVLLATRKLECEGGIAITASHNPSEWNALKFCDKKGLFLQEKKINQIHASVLRGFGQDTHPRSRPSSWSLWVDFNTLGRSISNSTAYKLHINQVMRNIDQKSISDQKFKVAIDPGGGAGSVIDREFLEMLGCKVCGIHEYSEEIRSNGSSLSVSARDRDFPRKPEPIPENLQKLCLLVKKEKADIGFAQDPDGDRLSVVTEEGRAVGEEYTLVLAGKAFLTKKKTDIACNLSTSMMIDDLAHQYGVKVFRTKIGELHVTTKLLNDNLLFGGEGNGGVIVPKINLCRDSITAMGLILELMAGTKKRISKIIEEIPGYCMKKLKQPVKKTYENKNSDELYEYIFKVVQQAFPEYLISKVDGIKVYNKESWLHIRLSNTEPVIRLMAESKNETLTDELLRKGSNIVSHFK
jgi:phosphomannomutase